MKWFKKLFSKKHSEKPVPPIPTMEEIINHLYDKALQFANDEIIKVIYSNDRSKRFILLKSEKGFYKYIYEEICVYDELDWEYFAFVNNAYPGWWEPKGPSGHSFFGTEEEAISALQNEDKYKLYF